MAVNEWTVVLTEGAVEPVKVFWFQNKTTPYDLTGKTAKLRIKPKGLVEFEFACTISNGPAGEITIPFTNVIVAAYTFKEAEIAMQVDDRIIQKGMLIKKKFYEC